jgi:hypothetical protein
MLAATRPTRRGGASRPARGQRRLGAQIGKLAALALARPGTAALMLLFGGVGTAISVNALWLQSGHHPLPLFRPAPAAQPKPIIASPAPPVPPPRMVEAPAAPPGAPLDLHPREADAAPAPRPLPPKPAHRRDPIGDLIGATGPAPVPPARPGHHKSPLKPSAHVKPSAQAKPAAKSLNALIERTTASR